MAGSANKRQQAQRRRADATVTAGIETEIENCHQLSALQRIREVSLFITLYLAGVAWFCYVTERFNLHWLGIIPMGIGMNSLGILIHEGLHGLLARNVRLNHLFGFVCGAPLLISASAYRATHSDHHFDFGRKRDYGTYQQHLDNRCFIWAAYFAQLCFGSILYVLLIPQVPSYHLKRVHQLTWHRLPRALFARSYLSFIMDFFKAARTFDLQPLGRVEPLADSTTCPASSPDNLNSSKPEPT